MMDTAALLERDSLEKMIQSFEERITKARENPRIPKSKEIFYEIMKEYFENVYYARERGKPLAWIGLLFPPEILLAMDVVPFVVEQYIIQLLASGRGYEYFDFGEGYGFDKEACSPHLATIGAAQLGLVGKPDFIICAGPQPCDSQSAMFDVLADMFEVPIFYCNFPYRFDEEALEHFKRELQDMVRFLEEHTGRKMDLDKLRELIKNSQECQEYFMKLMALRDCIPSPLGARDAFSFFGPRMASEGKPKTTLFMKTLYEETKAKAERGEGVVEVERHRVVTNGAYPFWYMKLFDWMEQEFGAVVTVDLANCYPLEPVVDSEDPFYTLAHKTFCSNLAVKTAIMPYHWVAEQIGKKAKESHCDACIYFAHFGCKHGCGRNRVVLEQIKKHAGIPSLILDIDAGNPMVVTASQMKRKIEEYFHMLEGK